MSVTTDFYTVGFTNQENTHHLPEGFVLALQRLSFALRTRKFIQARLSADKVTTAKLGRGSLGRNGSYSDQQGQYRDRQRLKKKC